MQRRHEIQRIRNDLERDSFPRLQMALLVTLTGAAGLAASYALLHAGFTEMWLRYLAAFGIAYLVFLMLLWLWLRTRADDYVDFPDPSGMVPSHSGGGSGTGFGGGGGSFDGGGASASFDAPSGAVASIGDADDSIGTAVDAVAGADEAAIPLLVLLLIGALLLSSLFMIYAAPVLFAELLVDGVLSASLYRRLRGLKTRHWIATALRRTVWPFALTAAFVAATGWAMALYAPQAHSIGEVVSHWRHGK